MSSPSHLCLLCLFPGPGMYNPKLKSKIGNRMVVKDKRFKPIKAEVPGPGAYEVSIKAEVPDQALMR